jgi:D-alanyl-D-alanine carboxypeptidase/D-alanyl-D-alanine-endopeptidase (penicillin-binding protein 4)
VTAPNLRALGAAIAALLSALPAPAGAAVKPAASDPPLASSQPRPAGPPLAEIPPKELEAVLRSIVEASPIAGARAGILVMAIDSGQVLYARDPDVLLNPASNVKLVTTAAALARLGPEYRFSTEFLVDGPSAGGSSPRTLFVRGRGDPSIVTERLWGIAADLEHLGIRRIGELVLDDGFFDPERHGPGFDQESGDRSYLAPSGALSLNFNSVAVHVGPGDRPGQRARVELEPASDYVEVENRAVTVPASGRRRVTVSSVPIAGGRQRIVVEGRVPAGSRPQAVWRKIDEPALYFGATLRKLLELRGVKVGRVRAGPVAEGAKLVHVAESDSLAEVVRRLNKTSNNFTAEQLLETLGAEVKGAPGSWAKGVAAVEEFLAEVGIPRGAYVMKNGSGLNDTNRFSARQLVTLLRAMWTRFPLQAEYLGSLPVAGRDGTIRWRMEGTEAAGRLRAKTGTLESVTSLSGYVENAGKQPLAFSILVNDYPGRAGAVVRTVDALGGALAASGGPGGLGAAVALAKAKEPAVAPVAAPADLARTARTYYALGRAGDPRNEPFLRTALRTEGDPALKLAVAECVYLSETDGETARRTFLEAIAPDGQALFRLWSALAGDAAPPVVPSLADLAGEGSPDALAKLVELSPAGALDGRLAGALADALASVAASAPAELVQALRSATPAAADSAIGAIGAGLARSEEKDHPFPAALRALATKEGEPGAYAKALLPRLDEAVAAGKAARAAPSLVPAAATAPARAP